MSRLRPRALRLFGAAATLAALTPLHAQDHTGHMMAEPGDDPPMWHADLGGGWGLMGMAQLFPIVTISAPGSDDGPLRRTEWYLTQPALMANLVSPGARWVLRTTLDLEGVTIENGELTPGGWGEGFIDKRHPHTLLHELMLSLNLGSTARGASISAGKGFAPYGTDDPMGRPAVKYPINHHLSQILERWTMNLALFEGGWSVEGGLFGGAEPEGPYDLSNIESFGDSWSVRFARRFGAGAGTGAEWEISASHARVREEHHEGEAETTALWNAALRHMGAVGDLGVYGLLEASMSDPEEGEGTFSVLGEARLDRAGHRPYVRVEVATRPEFAREGPTGSDDFFRYQHGDAPVGATRWIVSTVGYGYRATAAPRSFRPFVEVQHFRAAPERGGTDPEALFGTGSLWAVTVGARIYLGGGPMRMGSYGLLDPMTHMEN